MAQSDRLRDDVAAYRQNVLESTGPSRYTLNRPTRAFTRDSVTLDPRVTTQGLPVWRCKGQPLVDVDSDLLGITRRAGACNAAKYSPRRDGKCNLVPSASKHIHVTDMDTEDCRISNPPCTLRGTGINRFEWLCRDPQEKALAPFPRAPVNYRAVAKDNHRPLIEDPIRDAALPPQPAAAHNSAPYSSVNVGKDIQAAIASFPEMPVMQHWRDAGEIRRIMGMCACRASPDAAEEQLPRLQAGPAPRASPPCQA